MALSIKIPVFFQSGDMIVAATKVFHAVGSSDFDEELVTFLNLLLPIDHCVVFTFSASGEAGHLFTHGRMDKTQADKLASDYIDSYYKDDPNVQNILKEDDDFWRTDQDDMDEKYDSQYRNHFFDRNELIDKAASVGKLEDGYVYCNFYRMTDSGIYSDADRQLIENLLPAVTALISTHYKMFRLLNPDQEGSSEQVHVSSLVHNIISKAQEPFNRLTKRERQVCERIVLGYTSVGIGLDLQIEPSSVITYRRRAYEKLGITSQNELFALCLSAVKSIPAQP